MSNFTANIQFMKKSDFLRVVFANVITPPSVVNRIIIGLNKQKLLPKGHRHSDPELSWKDICLIIYSVYMSPTTVDGIINFAKLRKNRQKADEQLLGGILEAITNANEVKMVFISTTHIIVMKEQENLFFGEATPEDFSDIPLMVDKAVKVPGFIFRNILAAIQIGRSAILN